jgi:glutamyl/glutaminyl-tRNA synthetase
MPLPKINTPTYELVLPSNGKQITDSIVQILGDCILTKDIKVESLATFDIEFLFLNVRAKSVGETVEVNITCPDDGETKVEMEIAIDDIKVQKTRGHKNIIKLDDELMLKLKYPSLDQFIESNFETSGQTSDVSQSLSMITSCVDAIYNEEESWEAADCTKKELDEFIEQLNTKQFKEVEKFFTTMPKLSHKIKVKNPNTGVESEVVLEGLASFFS